MFPNNSTVTFSFSALQADDRCNLPRFWTTILFTINIHSFRDLSKRRMAPFMRCMITKTGFPELDIIRAMEEFPDHARSFLETVLCKLALIAYPRCTTPFRFRSDIRLDHKSAIIRERSDRRKSFINH